MKHFRSLGLAVAFLVGAAVAIVSTATDYVVKAVSVAKAFAYDLAINIVAGLPEPEPQKVASLRGFVVHRDNRRRQIKRQAPRIEDSWRMCPST